MTNQSQHLIVSTDQSTHEHMTQLKQLEQAACAGIRCVDLSLGSAQLMRPSIAFGYVHAVRNLRANGVQVIATAHLPLVGALACAWFAADLRRISPGSYIILPILAPEPEVQADTGGKTLTVVSADDVVRSAESESYLRCLDSIEEFVHIPDILGRTLFCADLERLLLIGPLPKGLSEPMEEPASDPASSSDCKVADLHIPPQSPRF